jgi:RNase adaptor protein for sRNA GlmZ degradation
VPDAMALVTSFGYLHAPALAADLTIDLRESYRDPHFDPALRELTADDPRVAAAVMATPGIRVLFSALTAAAVDLLATQGHASIAVGCAGGRHRGPAVAAELGRMLSESGIPVTVTHRDISKPVTERSGGR